MMVNSAQCSLVILVALWLNCRCTQVWANHPDSSLNPDPNPNQQQENSFQEINHQERVRKCVPILNLASKLTPTSYNSSNNNNLSADIGDADNAANESKSRARAGRQPISLSFAVGDIDMPISSPSSSVHSALKLLSTFDQQLSGGYGDPEATGPDGSGDDQEAANEEDTANPEAANVIRFRHNRLHISGLNLSMLNVHLYRSSEPRFGLGVMIKNTTLTGQFSYSGPMLVLGQPKSPGLQGHYRMSIDDILLTASSNLTKQVNPMLDSSSNNNTDPLNQATGGYSLITNDFKMNISSLGYISIDIFDALDSTRPTSNYMLKLLQRLLQKTIKRTYYSFENYIRHTLELEGRRFLDCELTRFTPILAANSQAGGGGAGQPVANKGELNKLNKIELNQQDDLARIINSEIGNSQLSRVGLPNFEYQRNVLGTGATIYFTNGSLSGLDHVRLFNETKIKFQNEHLLINASIGWFDLKPYYNWSLSLGGGGGGSSNNNNNATRKPDSPMTAGFVGFHLARIDFDAVISSKALRPSASNSFAGGLTKLVVDELTIRRLDTPKMDIGGLPGMNRLTRTMVNFFMGRLKQRVANSIQPALKQQLERALNRLPFFN